MQRLHKILGGIAVGAFFIVASLFNPESALSALTKYGLPGIYNSSQFTLTDGSGSALSTDSNGRLILSPSSNITISGGVNGHWYPSSNNTKDLGFPTSSWRNLSVSGTAQIATLVVGPGGCIGCSSGGIATVPSGGTGRDAFTANTVLLGNGTSALATTTLGTNGQVLTLVNGVPTWQTTSTAANISGNLPVTALNSGTSASNATFWRGDGTWSSVLQSTFGVIGDFAVNTNKFNVTASNGNTAIAGTLAVVGNTALTGTLGVTATSTFTTTTVASTTITRANVNTLVVGSCTGCGGTATYYASTFSKAINNTTDIVLAHGLGKTPSLITADCPYASVRGYSQSNGAWTAGSTANSYAWSEGGSANGSGMSNSANLIHIETATDGAIFDATVGSVDATNITLTVSNNQNTGNTRRCTVTAQ